MSDTIHSGHRERQRKKFLAHGLAGFSDIEAIELLLFFALPRRNTNVLAHALLDRFGNLRGVLTADLASLKNVPGIGENAALLIRLVTELNCRYLEQANEERALIRNSEEAAAYVLPYFAYRREECILLVTTDVGGRVIQCHRVAEGGPNSVEFAVSKMLKLVLDDKATHVVLAHNHISGVAVPSMADVAATRSFRETLLRINVSLIDHIVVSDGDYVSMKDSNAFQDD